MYRRSIAGEPGAAIRETPCLLCTPVNMRTPTLDRPAFHIFLANPAYERRKTMLVVPSNCDEHGGSDNRRPKDSRSGAVRCVARDGIYFCGTALTNEIGCKRDTSRPRAMNKCVSRADRKSGQSARLLAFRMPAYRVRSAGTRGILHLSNATAWRGRRGTTWGRHWFIGRLGSVLAAGSSSERVARASKHQSCEGYAARSLVIASQKLPSCLCVFHVLSDKRRGARVTECIGAPGLPGRSGLSDPVSCFCWLCAAEYRSNELGIVICTYRYVTSPIGY